MKPGIFLLSLILLSVSTALAATDARGSRSCRKWVEERAMAEGRKEMNRIPVLISKSWFLGYLAGRASSTKRSLHTEVDDESIFLWLDNYCRDHPQEDLASAGLALERELTSAKAKP